MTELALSTESYRYVDVGSKLLGVALVAGALETGIASAPGIALAFAGAVSGVSTVFLTEELE